jgi:hypothetical protein
MFNIVFPCQNIDAHLLYFSQVPEAFDKLIGGVEHTVSHAVEQEEKIPLSMVTNFSEVVTDIKQKLCLLRDNPQRTEKPIIYHLDVGKGQSLLKEMSLMQIRGD